MSASFFRSKGYSSPQTGQDQTALDANPSEESGPVVTAPAWEKYVTNTDAVKSNQSAVRTEMDSGRRIDRNNAAIDRDERQATNEIWKGSAGKLLRKVGRNPAEALDPEQFVDHPTGGAEARRSLWDRERRAAKDEHEALSLQLQDPAFKARKLKDDQRMEIEGKGNARAQALGAQGWDMARVELEDPEYQGYKSQLTQDSTFEADQQGIAQKAYDAKLKAFQLDSTDPEAWFQQRRSSEINANRGQITQEAQAGQAQADEAAVSLQEESKALATEMSSGVTAERSKQIQDRQAQMQAGKAGIEQAKQGEQAKIEGIKQAAAEATKPVDDSWDVTRGLKTAVSQLPQLAYGAAGLIGKTAEDITGFGKGLKEWGLKKYAQSEKDMEHLQRDNDSATTAWSKMTEKGDVGAMVDFAQYAIGYGGGQVLESLGVAAIGGAIGAATTGPAAPAGGVAGAVGGVVAKGAAKKLAFGLIEKAIASEAAKIVEKAAIKKGITLTAEELAKQAASSGIRKIAGKSVGSSIALVMNGQMQAMGSIYPEAEKQAALEGREMDRGDIAKVWLMSAASGTLEGVADKFGVDLLKGNVSGKLAKAGLGRAGSAAVGAVADSAVEGSTEFGQTVLERLGANKSITDAEAQREYVDSAAMGAFIGGGVGAVGGALNPDGTPKTDPPPVQETPEQVESSVNNHLATIDPTIAPATQEEIAGARGIANPSGGNQSLAESVQIERELKIAEETETTEYAAADEAIAQATLQGDKGAITVAEEAKAKLQRGRASLVRAVMKVTSGTAPDELTRGELESLGFKTDTLTGKPKVMSDKELQAVGLTQTLLYADTLTGSPILTDEGIARVAAVSPTAGKRSKMTEAQAIQAAKAKFSAESQNGAEGELQTGFPSSDGVVPLETNAPAEFIVQMRDGPPIRVQAATAQDAENEAASQFESGTNQVLQGQTVAVTLPSNDDKRPKGIQGTNPANVPQRPSGEEDGASGNDSSVQTATGGDPAQTKAPVADTTEMVSPTSLAVGDRVKIGGGIRTVTTVTKNGDSAEAKLDDGTAVTGTSFMQVERVVPAVAPVATHDPATIAAKARGLIASAKDGRVPSITPQVAEVAQENGIEITPDSTIEDVMRQLNERYPTVKLADVPTEERNAIRMTVQGVVAKWKSNPAVNAVLDISSKHTTKAAAVDGKVQINTALLIEDAATARLTPEETETWLARLIFEELHHVSQVQAFHDIHKASGSPLKYELWLDDYLDTLLTEFKSIKGEGDTRSLYDAAIEAYGPDLASGSPFAQVAEINRMILQDMLTGNPTEATKAALSNPDLSTFFQSAIDALKTIIESFRGDKSKFSKDLIDNLDRVEALLVQYALPDTKPNSQPRAGSPKADPAKPAKSRKSAGNASTAAQDRAGEAPSGSGTIPPRSESTRPPLAVGTQVEFTGDDGRVVQGTISLINSKGQARVDLDSGGAVPVSLADLRVMDKSEKKQPSAPANPTESNAPAETKSEAKARPAPNIGNWTELQANTREFNEKRTTKARKSEIIARQVELRKTLRNEGFTADQIQEVEMLRGEVPIKTAETTTEPATEEAKPSPEELPTVEGLLSAIVEEIGGWVKTGTGNGSRAMDRNWERGAIRRYLAGSSLMQTLIGGKTKGKEATAKINIGKATSFAEIISAIEKLRSSRVIAVPAVTPEPVAAAPTAKEELAQYLSEQSAILSNKAFQAAALTELKNSLQDVEITVQVDVAGQNATAEIKQNGKEIVSKLKTDKSSYDALAKCLGK